MSGDEVNHPDHYTVGNLETIEIIEDTVEDPVSYAHGNALKYLCRFPHKGDPRKDLRKARWYIERILWLLDGGGDGDGTADRGAASG